MYYSIDRFEENFAVLIADEDGSRSIVERKMIPAEAEEGSLLLMQNGTYIYDADETARRRKEFFLRTRNLTKK